MNNTNAGGAEARGSGGGARTRGSIKGLQGGDDESREGLPANGPLCYSMIKDAGMWVEQIEARGRQGGRDRGETSHEELVLPASRVADFIGGENVVGRTRFIVSRTKTDKIEEGATGKGFKIKSQTVYHCHHGPEHSRGADDKTQLKHDPSDPKARCSSILSGKSIKVGCQCRFSVSQTYGQAALEQPLVTIRVLESNHINDAGKI